MEAKPLGIRGPLLVLFAAAITMLPRLWEGDIYRDEVLYAAIAKGILTGGDWLNLHLGSDPYWNKPPLMFWLTAGAYRLLGVSVYSAKLPSALFGVGACLVLFFLVRRLVDERTALLAALVLATTPRFVRTSATFRLDSGVTFLALLSFWWYLRALERPGLRAWVLAGVAWGLGFMAKGPFALTAPYLFLIYLAVQRDLRPAVSRGFLVSVVAGAAVLLPWHLQQLWHWGRPFLDVYLGAQVIDRFAGRLWLGPQPSYAQGLLHDDWPWLVFLAIGTVAAVGAAGRGDRSRLFVLCWAAGYLLLLVAAQHRRPRYLYQFYPPAAVLTACGIDAVLPASWRPHLPRAVLALFGAAGLLLLVLPIPVHTAAARPLRALAPALAVLEPGRRTPVAGFRIRSQNTRAAFLFYLDRDLRNFQNPDRLPRRPGRAVATRPDDAALLEGAGWRRAYSNERFVLLTRDAAASASGSRPGARRRERGAPAGGPARRPSHPRD